MPSRGRRFVGNASKLSQDFIQSLRCQYAFAPRQELIGICPGNSIPDGCVEDAELSFQLAR